MLNLHVLDLDSEKSILFFPKSMRFFTVNKQQATQFIDIANQLSGETSQSSLVDIDNDSYNYALSLLNETVKIDQGKFNCTILPRLVLNISNDCNLRCKYCYASGGNYSGKRRLMDLETLQKALDSFYNHFTEIETIQLFGGEPTMNIVAIEYVCKYIKNHSYMTQIGIVTNGTIMTKQLLDLIEMYNIKVTVSIDVEDLHDKVRPFASGEGSWKIIQNNISKMQKIGQPDKLEVTYTQQHIKNGLSIHDVVSELNNQFDIKNIHLAPVSTTNTEYHIVDMNCFMQSVDDFLADANLSIAPYSILLTMLKSLKSKLTNQYICFAGFGTIAVSSKGDVYPCFYFCENKDFLHCSVFDSKDIFDSKIRSMQEKYIKFSRYEQLKCQECFAFNLCHGCLGDNYYETGNIYQTSQDICEMTRGMLEHLLVNLSKMSVATKKG